MLVMRTTHAYQLAVVAGALPALVCAALVGPAALAAGATMAALVWTVAAVAARESTSLGWTIVFGVVSLAFTYLQAAVGHALWLNLF